jgi:hypothetical protein
MRWLTGRAGTKAGSRLALAAVAVALAAGVTLALQSRALESGAAHVLLPSDTAPLVTEDSGASRTVNPPAQPIAQGDHDVRNQNSPPATLPSTATAPKAEVSAAASASNAVHPVPGRGHAAALSRGQAVALVQRRYHARVVRAHVVQGPAGRRLYVLRLLSASGTVWTVRLDPTNGSEMP